MLKNEIRTLNNEMSLLQYKLKTADKGELFQHNIISNKFFFFLMSLIFI